MKSAIIGLGVIGTVHAQVLTSQKKEIAAVCDTDESRFSVYAELPHYTDYKKMLDEIRPDVVHICTPHYLHAEMIIESLKRNINVFCEKPMCIKREDIAKILKAEAESSAQLGVCLQNRYNAANIFVKDYLKNKHIRDAAGFVVWHRDKEYYNSAPWRGKRDTEGGGVLINQALHTLDLLQWFIGEPDYVTAAVSNLTLADDIEVEDTVSALFGGKENFTFFATNGGAVGIPVEITVLTDNDYIKLLTSEVIINDKPISFDKDERIYGKYCYGTGHERIIDDFYRCVQSGEKFAIDGTEGGKVLKLIFGVYESNGKKVKL